MTIQPMTGVRHPNCQVSETLSHPSLHLGVRLTMPVKLLAKVKFNSNYQENPVIYASLIRRF